MKEIDHLEFLKALDRVGRYKPPRRCSWSIKL
jgi:hypothetical protein